MQKVFYFITLISISFLALGQDTQDTTFQKASVVYAENTYHAALNKQLNIYSGRDFKTYSQTSEEHPYFLSDDWAIGTIVYESDFYKEVPLLFDLTTEKVISENPFNGAKMELVYNKIDRFEIHEHVFVKLQKNPAFASEMNEGFYEILHDGHLKLYAKRKKDFQKRIKDNKLLMEFDEKNKYFLFNGNTFVKVTGKKSIIKALGDDKKLPKPSGLKINPNSNNKVEDKLIFLTKFYDLNTPSL